MAARPPFPPPIPSDIDILNRIHAYVSINGAFPNDHGDDGMYFFVHNYLQSDIDPRVIRQRMETMQREYLATRRVLERSQRAGGPLIPPPDDQKYALCHLVWHQTYSSDATPDEASLSGPQSSFFNDSTSPNESSPIHGRQDVDHQASPLDQANQASTSRTPHLLSDDSDTPTPTPTPNPNPNPNPSAAESENTPEKSYSGDVSSNTNVSPDEDTPQKYSSADQSNTNTIVSPNPVSFPSRNFKGSASSSMTKKRRLFDNLNQQGGDKDTTAAAQDINILTKMIEYSESEVKNKVYPYVSAETLSDFVKNWLHSDADPGQVGKRIQEMREMYAKYLMMNNNNDEGEKPVYSDSPDDRLLLDLSKKLWHHEFENVNDDSGGNSSADKS